MRWIACIICNASDPPRAYHLHRVDQAHGGPAVGRSVIWRRAHAAAGNGVWGIAGPLRLRRQSRRYGRQILVPAEWALDRPAELRSQAGDWRTGMAQRALGRVRSGIRSQTTRRAGG